MLKQDQKHFFFIYLNEANVNLHRFHDHGLRVVKVEKLY